MLDYNDASRSITDDICHTTSSYVCDIYFKCVCVSFVCLKTKNILIDYVSIIKLALFILHNLCIKRNEN